MSVTHTLNGVDLDGLSATIEAVIAQPALARFEFRTANQWIDGGHSRSSIQGFMGVGQEDTSRTDPFTVDADEPTVLLGHNLAPNAGEYLLHALAACLTGTIAYHSAARGIALESLRCTVHGDVDLHGFLGLDPTVRPGFQSIRVDITATGDFDDAQFAELTGLTHFSPVRSSIVDPVPVTITVARG